VCFLCFFVIFFPFFFCSCLGLEAVYIKVELRINVSHGSGGGIFTNFRHSVPVTEFLKIFQYLGRYGYKFGGRDRFQRERLGTAFPKLFSQWERRSQEFNSSLIIRYTFCKQSATYAIIRNSPYSI